MKILFFVSHNKTFEVPVGAWGEHSIEVMVSDSDLGLRGLKKRLFHVKSALHLARRARHYDALALCTVGIEAFFVGFLRRFLCPATRVVCADFLIPRPGRSDAMLGKYLRSVHAFILIRRGDAPTLKKRFGYSVKRCYFAYFPAPENLAPEGVEGDFLYAAGNAHRDWKTLLAALELAPRRAILSPGEPIEVPDSLKKWVEVRPALPTAQGRALLAQARLVVMPFEETPLPCGPLVLLDAMAMSKAVVVSEVNGSRDYVEHEKTALVVPPDDASAMAQAISRLWDDASLRQKLGKAAQQHCRSRFRNDDFIAAIVAQCGQT